MNRNILTNTLPRRDFLRAGTLATMSSALAPEMAAEESTGGSDNPGYIDAHVHVWTADTLRYPLKPG